MAIGDVRRDALELLRVRPPEDTIATAPTGTTGVSMTTGSATMWTAGDIAEFTLDGEKVLILANSGASVTSMVRGYDGTTAGTHTNAERLRKTPVYGMVEVDEAIAKCAEMLWPEVYEVGTGTLTYSSSSYLYDTPSDYETFIELVQVSSGTIEDVVRLRGVREMHVPSSISTSLKALRVVDWHRTDATATLFYRKKASTGTADVALQHLLALGAARLLLVAKGAEEADDEPEDQDTGQRILRGSSFIESEYQKALASYRSTLRNKYPSRRRVIM